MKKVMILCNSLGGLIKFRKELLSKLYDEEYNIYVLAPENNYKKEVLETGCKYIEVKIDNRGVNIFHDLKLLYTYKKYIKQIKPDIVLTYTIKPNVYGGYICRKLKIPYIANITGLGSAVENPGILQEITVFLYKIALKKAKCVFFQNRENLKFMLKRKIINSNYKLIPGSGVNLEYHKLLPYPNNKNITFLFISRIIKEKGIEDYIETAKKIKEKYPNTEFHILGSCDNNYYINLFKELEQKKIVIYDGKVNDVREYHKISNCTIHPSYYPEGMSNALLESCAAGRPIITTNRAGCREIVDDGINGYMVNMNDIEELINKVEKFINLPYEEKKKMGINSRKKVEKEFNRNIVIEAYMEEIKKE